MKVCFCFVIILEELTQWSSSGVWSFLADLCGYVCICMQQHTYKRPQFIQCWAGLDLRI